MTNQKITGTDNIQQRKKDTSDSSNKLVMTTARWKLLAAIVVVGILTGLATFLMKEGIKGVGLLITSFTKVSTGNPIFLVLPVAGLLLAMIFQKYIIHTDLSHGTAVITRDLKDGQYRLSPSNMYTSLIGCGLTLGFGGSAGAEGPSAYTGAAIASNFSRYLGINQRWTRILLGIGAGAGIAGIFKSPVGGALFTLEVIGLELTTIPVVALFTCCLISGCTALALGGFAIDIKFIQHTPFDIANILWILGLGVVCGLYSLYYNATKTYTGKILARFSNPWYKALVAGVALSVSIYFFPALFGEGYGILDKIINGEASKILDYSPFYSGLGSVGVLMFGTFAVLLLKGIMVSATIDGGGVAGDFAPTLFAGCLVGYLFGLAVNHWFGASIPPENFALLGMAGVMSGAIKAPMMAIFITSEMSNSYHFIFGYLVVAAISYGIVWLFKDSGFKIKKLNESSER